MNWNELNWTELTVSSFTLYYTVHVTKLNWHFSPFQFMRWCFWISWCSKKLWQTSNTPCLKNKLWKRWKKVKGGKWVHLTQTYLSCYPCARNHQSWWRFVEVTAKIILHSFFGGTHCYRRIGYRLLALIDLSERRSIIHCFCFCFCLFRGSQTPADVACDRAVVCRGSVWQYRRNCTSVRYDSSERSFQSLYS